MKEKIFDGKIMNKKKGGIIMKAKFTIILSAVFLLLTFGIAGAQQVVPLPRAQTLLQGSLIPKFVDPLPVCTTATVPGITCLNATAKDTVGSCSGMAACYDINLEEFKAQILPFVDIPIAPAGRRGRPGAVLSATNTASWVWGYLTDSDVALMAANTVRPSYLGPVVLAARGIETRPTYINNLPSGLQSFVQDILPVDQTLDWADPLGYGCAGQLPIGVCAGIHSGPQPAVPHIHGGEVAPAYDGGPDAWWTPNQAQTGAGFVGTTFKYPNKQQAGTIWFHDHALGITRLNVYAGMAGVHIITDTANEPPQVILPANTCTPGTFGGCLPNELFDIPLIIQDRSFDTQGQLFYNLASNPQPNPTVHPYWIPEFIGDTIVVNGKTWPFLDVQPRQYRFRLLNGSNARFYDLTLSNGAPFTVIATDDGYLDLPVNTPNLIIAPGERYEVIVDFSLFPNTNIIMNNSARTPFPGGARPVRGTTDTVMQFRVILPLDNGILDPAPPTYLRPNNPINTTLNDIRIKAVTGRTVPVLGVCPAETLDNPIVRQLTLNEVIGPGGPLELVLNNTKFNKVITGFVLRESEVPAVGDTEIWEIINITADAHPIHTHLASFRLLNRQQFDAAAWTTVYAAQLAAAYPIAMYPNGPDGMGPPKPYLIRNADCAIGGNPEIGPYLIRANRKRVPMPTIPVLPLPYEEGWKDTVIAYPGEITRFVIRWAETDFPVPVTCTNTTPGCAGALASYPFTEAELIGGYGYVWHCHIIDHEDNEMMRPYRVGASRQTITNLLGLKTLPGTLPGLMPYNVGNLR